MSGTFTRSWDLVRETMSVLTRYKELLLFPVLSGIAVMVIIASFILPLLFSGMISLTVAPLLLVVLIFLFYFVSYFIVIFFNTGLIACAYIRLQGGNPSIGDGLRSATGHIGQILVWTLISATVGLILSSIRNRGGLAGSLVSGLLGAAWSLVTFFVIPVMIFEEKGTIEAIGESWSLFKKTWGENIVGSVGLGIVLIPVILMVIVTLFAAITGSSLLIPLIVVLILLIGICGVLYATLRGIFVAALYSYAKTGQVPGDFREDFIEGAFVAKNQPGNI
jgi:hypothetical protein